MQKTRKDTSKHVKNLQNAHPKSEKCALKTPKMQKQASEHIVVVPNAQTHLGNAKDTKQHVKTRQKSSESSQRGQGEQAEHFGKS